MEQLNTEQQSIAYDALLIIYRFKETIYDTPTATLHRFKSQDLNTQFREDT